MPARQATTGARSLLRAMRPHQWVKNILLLVPVVVGHRLLDREADFRALASALVFCLCASSAYLVNDLLDLEADRHHLKKCARPFACGELPLWVGWLAAPVLLAAGIGSAIALGQDFLVVTILYVLLTLAYSLYLKRLVLIDVLLLAALYTIRIMAGGAATGIVISHWLLGFAMFLFLSLALMKRFSELSALDLAGARPPNGRGYAAADLEQLALFGSVSGYLAVLVLALYLSSPEVRPLYARFQWLWLMCPLFIYWISRAWMLARRGEMDEDPVLFALKDRSSYLTGALIGVIVLLAL